MSPMRKLLLWWAVSWSVAAGVLALQRPPYLGCFDCEGWGGGTSDPLPTLTAFLALLSPPANGEVLPAMLPPFALALLAFLIIKRLRAKRQPPAPEDSTDQS